MKIQNIPPAKIYLNLNGLIYRDHKTENNTIIFIRSLLPVVFKAKRISKKINAAITNSFFLFTIIFRLEKIKMENIRKTTGSMEVRNVRDMNCLDRIATIKKIIERYNIKILYSNRLLSIRNLFFIKI